MFYSTSEPSLIATHRCNSKQYCFAEAETLNFGRCSPSAVRGQDAASAGMSRGHSKAKSSLHPARGYVQNARSKSNLWFRTYLCTGYSETRSVNMQITLEAIKEILRQYFTSIPYGLVVLRFGTTDSKMTCLWLSAGRETSNLKYETLEMSERLSKKKELTRQHDRLCFLVDSFNSVFP